MRSLTSSLCVAALTAGVTLAACRAADAQATGPSQAEPTRVPQAGAPESPAPPTLQFDLIAGSVDQRIDRLIAEMTLAEKVGQLVQVFPNGDSLTDELRARIRAGQVGSVFYAGDAQLVAEAQAEARKTRLGIPLVIARDVVHGFKTVFPIPLGQAASWNPELVERAARLSAIEARTEGVQWTFAPMVDVCRDPRWGRVAETLGEDPALASDLAAAMVRGFQQEEDGVIHGVAACAKHFAAYGLSEGGRDYNRASVSDADLFNVILPPFRASLAAGCEGLMTTFSEVNGVPGTAHADLINGVAKGRWGFDGVVVSDWASITEMVVHGYSPTNRHAAEASIRAGVDMDMCSPAFADHLADLVRANRVPESRVDDAVRRVLRMKVALQGQKPAIDRPQRTRKAARELARQSIVLLKNQDVLPLEPGRLSRVAVIGPMADKPAQQFGCWSLDGEERSSVTPLAHLRERLAGKAEITYAAGAANTFTPDDSLIAAAVEAAQKADVALLFIGEDALLSGEARSRADLTLPGVQSRLVEAVAATGAPTVCVVMAGRPLAIESQIDSTSATLFAWHPGSQAGPAIGDLLFGDASPSGKLPITFPRAVGQIPLYYAHTNTGRPAPAVHQPLIGSRLEDLPSESQYKTGYLDADSTPLFPFGFGLSYTSFEYDQLELTGSTVSADGVLGVRVRLRNTGERAGAEVAQLYLRDRFSSTVRPVRELKRHRRAFLEPGEETVLEFALTADDLAYYNNQRERVLEPGDFDLWIGGDSEASLHAEFELVESNATPARAEVASPRRGSTSR